MAKYRKKPVVVEATQWFKNGDHPLDNVDVFPVDEKGRSMPRVVVRYFRRPELEYRGHRKCGQCGHIWCDHGWVKTLEGGHIVCPGDWIITGIKGEKYPCKPDIFELTYERVE
jgi:hypothetical protein